MPRTTASEISIPGMAEITASVIEPPPAWALLQRQLIRTIEDAVELFNEKYTYPGGGQFYTSTLDDAYETRSGRAQLYYVGASDSLLDLALQDWNATTRFYDDGIVVKPDDPIHHKKYLAQTHNEYYNAADPDDCDWFHMGEGNQPFYDFGVASPGIPENARRAMRFADMYIGEDPEAPNYDKSHRIIRSPLTGSRGPLFHVDTEFAKKMLGPTSSYRRAEIKPPGPPPTTASLYPTVADLEEDWNRDPKRKTEVSQLFDRMVLNSDIPMNLTATALVTNAYLYTGHDSYKQWVLDYVEAWTDRMNRNGGMMPDNVGPTGQIGEQRDGQAWGGAWGWDCGRAGAGDLLVGALCVAAECAQLLTGDDGYLDLLRSQLKLLIDQAVTEDGELRVPHRFGRDGWSAFKPMNIRDPAHLWHASMNKADYELITHVREGTKTVNWNQAHGGSDKSAGESERARFQYYDGKNPTWPEDMMRAEYDYVVRHLQAMRDDPRDLETRARDAFWPPNPCVSKGLIEVTMGTPQNIYRGGLLRATVRYFDRDRGRAGLPPDVAALVFNLSDESVGVHLVNLSNTDRRHLIVQTGAFGEHQIVAVRHESQERKGLGANPATWQRQDWPLSESSAPVDDRYFAVDMPPSTTIKLDIKMRRFANRPTYAFPWHGDKPPIPFL